MKSHLQKLPPMASNLRRDDDDKRRETTRNDERRRHDASHANTAPTPRPPTINGNPSLRIREKNSKQKANKRVRKKDKHAKLHVFVSHCLLALNNMLVPCIILYFLVSSYIYGWRAEHKISATVN